MYLKKNHKSLFISQRKRERSYDDRIDKKIRRRSQKKFALGLCLHQNQKVVHLKYFWKKKTYVKQNS